MSDICMVQSFDMLWSWCIEFLVNSKWRECCRQYVWLQLLWYLGYHCAMVMELRGVNTYCVTICNWGPLITITLAAGFCLILLKIGVSVRWHWLQQWVSPGILNVVTRNVIEGCLEFVKQGEQVMRVFWLCVAHLLFFHCSGPTDNNSCVVLIPLLRFPLRMSCWRA